jgi:hypothetical protein
MYESKINKLQSLLKVEIFRLISAMGILITKWLLLVITYHLLLKVEANGIN